MNEGLDGLEADDEPERMLPEEPSRAPTPRAIGQIWRR